MMAFGKRLCFIQRFIRHGCNMHFARIMRPVETEFVDGVGRRAVEHCKDVLLQSFARLTGVFDGQILDLLVRDDELDLPTIRRQGIGFRAKFRQGAAQIGCVQSDITDQRPPIGDAAQQRDAFE